MVAVPTWKIPELGEWVWVDGTKTVVCGTSLTMPPWDFEVVYLDGDKAMTKPVVWRKEGWRFSSEKTTPSTSPVTFPPTPTTPSRRPTICITRTSTSVHGPGWLHPDSLGRALPSDSYADVCAACSLNAGGARRLRQDRDDGALPESPPPPSFRSATVRDMHLELLDAHRAGRRRGSLPASNGDEIAADCEVARRRPAR
jgi:hypothetical protein